MNSLFLLCGALLFLSVVSTTLSARLGIPLLLVFLAVGMLAGEDGIGRIDFDNFVQANVISQLALAVILLDGGLRTRPESFRIALKPSAVLATWGVFATVLLLGLFTMFYLGSDWKFGILMAAIVGSTDAGAVFSLLRNSGVRLNERVQATLEIESGANDPMAVFLVTALIGLIMQPERLGVLSFLWMLVRQLGFGLLLGWLGGKILAKLVGRLNLAEGLYALMIVSGGLLVFAFTNLIGGSGFLAVYLAGIIVGNQHSRATEHVLRVMDGLAWLAQATMFVVLGLLVTPTSMLEKGADALVIAVFLMLVARPAAVFGGLWKFHYSLREKAYISWLGLRGAVPISLAMMPLVMGVPNSKLLFDVAFAVVILSLLIQGTTIPVMARWLKSGRAAQTRTERHARHLAGRTRIRAPDCLPRGGRFGGRRDAPRQSRADFLVVRAALLRPDTRRRADCAARRHCFAGGRFGAGLRPEAQRRRREPEPVRIV